MEQAAHRPDAVDEFVEFRQFALGERFPTRGRRDIPSKSVEELANLDEREAGLARALDDGKAAEQSEAKTEVSPFYCNLRGVTPEQRKRKAEPDQALRLSRTTARELPDRVEFQFPAEASSIEMVAEWAVMERACCPFFDIELRLEREGGPFWLRLTGREGVKKFIREEFRAEWFR